MRAVLVKKLSDKVKLEINEIPLPEPLDHEVRLAVKCIGVNRPDILQKNGLYPPPKGSCPRLGLEASGIIEKIGRKVRGFKVGDTVCGLTPGGAYAEFVTLPFQNCAPIPKGMSFSKAAGIPEIFMTAWVNLFEHGRLQNGEKVLIHGGSSGVGSAAIQLANWKKTFILTTVKNKKKADFCQKLGAHHSIIYTKKDFEEDILNLTEHKGVDLILDMVGGEYINKNLKCLSHAGRLVQIAFLNGSSSKINLMRLMLKQLTITGSTLRSRSIIEKARILNLLKKNIWPEFESGKIDIKIFQEFNLEDVEKAHKIMENSDHLGKLVLVVNE